MNSKNHSLIKLFVVKIGGNVIDDEEQLESFLKDFGLLNERKILVHGGGKIASDIGNKLGIESVYHEGRRITDDATIDLVTMVYGGLINKKIVALLQSSGSNAIGLTGADANLIPAVKRPVRAIDYGWAGDISQRSISADKWKFFLENSLVPVVAPLTHDFQGHMLNTNGDTIAAAISIALSRYYDVNLIYCFEKNGVLENVDDNNSVIKNIDATSFLKLKKDDKLHAGILPKIKSALDSVQAGVNNVVIGNSGQLAGLASGLYGTSISK
jgi:acetylglutamate kinase